MGTRSLTRIYQDNNLIMTMYRQFDGYPDGHGADLKEIIESYKLVNGLPGGDTYHLANGMSELCALIVRDLKIKNPSGNIYLYPQEFDDCGQEFEYSVYGTFERDPIKLKIESAYNDKEVIYDGLLSDFKPK